jgi:hypothetical protein
MPKIDVIDEAIIDSSPKAVYRAILNEYRGVTHFGMPILEFKPRGTMDCEGAICDITAHSHGMTTKFSVKIIKMEEAKLIELQLSGDFVGIETWTFEPEGKKTNVKLHWKGATNRALFSLLSPFVSLKEEHSKAIQKQLQECNDYFCKK